METKIFEDVTLEMWILLGLGIITVILYSWMSENKSEGIRRYFRLTPKYIAFHITSSLMLFLVLEEIGGELLESYFPKLTNSESYHLTLSGLTGLFGSLFVAMIIDFGTRLRNNKKKEQGS